MELTKVVKNHSGRSNLPVLKLDFQKRRLGRQRVRLEDGTEAALFLPRGLTLKTGDLLSAEDGRLVRIESSPQPVVTACGDDWLTLARAAYHLGNRHAAVEIGHLSLSFEPDPALEAICRSLGLKISTEQKPFEPEGGPGLAGSHDHARP
ncbi:MAG: urease accessory protein UreE [Deltaproteobacteria bacterium]|nr:urease accessory protein UreE [Deltaproteobacteria bacterium]